MELYIKMRISNLNQCLISQGVRGWGWGPLEYMKGWSDMFWSLKFTQYEAQQDPPPSTLYSASSDPSCTQ